MQATEIRGLGAELVNGADRRWQAATQPKVVDRDSPASSSTSHSVETLILDRRSIMRPCQIVEEKLYRMLSPRWLPVSHIRLSVLIQGRRHC